MRFAVISPAAGLQKFSSLSRTHLLLAHVDNLLYWEFYQKLSHDPSQLLILDNSAYEGKMNMELVMERLKWLKPACLVMPDIMGGNAVENFALAVDFVRTWRHRLNCELMYVPQFNGTVKDFELMRDGITAMIEMFGIRWFGLPRIMAERGFSRAQLCLWIKDQNFERGVRENYVHALGMCAGSLPEYEELVEAQCDSCDSSAPVWRGWHGYSLKNGEAWAKNGTPVDFDVHPNTLTFDREQLIRENLKQVGVNA